MSRTASFYAFEPEAPGIPSASATGIFVTTLVDVLRTSADGLDVKLRWLQPAAPHASNRIAKAAAATRWIAGEVARVLPDSSRYLLFIYPKVPIVAHTNQSAFLWLARRVLQALAWKARITGQRIVVIVEDLPIEMAEGKATAGGPRPTLDVGRIRAIERTLFRAAHRLIAPPGFVDPIRETHGIDPDRFRIFRRNIYPPAVEAAPPEGIEFESGDVNFFYSGGVGSHVAPNFREMLRSIRNAPKVRLHVCGPGGDSVRSWLDELDVPNARHYGQLSLGAHDWLASRCDVGLILYPTDNPYNHLTPTMKYSAYLANGLAVLSTDLESVNENIRRDEIGSAMPIRELSVELLRWASRASLWSGFKGRAGELAAEVRSGGEMMGWIKEIARGE